MAAADAAAIDGGTPAEVLMDRAGRAVARTVIDVVDRRYGGKVVIVCGKGNNGGDGFVAARALEREGLSVRCLTVGDVSSSKGAAAEHLQRWLAIGGSVEPFEVDALAGDIAVDAIFGTGFKGPAEGEAAQAIEALSRFPGPVVAVDIPSGVDGATGRCDGPCVDADVTVAMGAEKIGTAVGAGAERAGTVVVADIGIPVTDAAAAMVEGADVADALPERSQGAHKRSSGTVVVFAGSDGMPGAALLTARAALRTGSGYVNLATTEGVRSAVAETTPEVVSLLASDSDVLSSDALERAKPILEKADAVAIGPGLSTGAGQRALLERVLLEVSEPIVIDADGLNVLAEDPSVLIEREHPSVLTPHPAELARLLAISTGDVQADRVAAASDAAERFGCVIVLKGHRSVIAAPGERVVVNPAGGPELATAGTGDVLTGVVAAYLAVGLDPFVAAWSGAFVHGTAGAIAAANLGSTGVLASDVADRIGAAADRIVEGSWY